MRHLLPLVLLVPLTLTAQTQEPPSVSVRLLSAEFAQNLAGAALAACSAQGYQVAVAVVDRAGNLQAFARDPLAGAHTIDVSLGKAYAAASFQTPTSQMMNNERLRDAPRVLLIGGGLPVRIGGHLYGALGVSGAPAQKVTGDVDEACAQAGIDAISEALEFGE